jgi:hypothetical protein
METENEWVEGIVALSKTFVAFLVLVALIEILIKIIEWAF